MSHWHVSELNGIQPLGCVNGYSMRQVGRACPGKNNGRDREERMEEQISFP